MEQIRSLYRIFDINHNLLNFRIIFMIVKGFILKIVKFWKFWFR